jgi:hypothetical protein
MAAISTLTQAMKAVPTATASILLFVPQTKQAIAALLSLTTQDVALLAIVLPLLTLVIVLSISTNRSTLASPGKFVEFSEEDAEERRKARAKDAAAIAHECMRQQQVHIVGAAGVGKSTLIRLLLMDNLREGNRLLPIYVPSLDSGYENAETMSLATALWGGLDVALRKELGCLGPPEAKDVFGILDRIAATNVTPLIVLDHFDDYLGANLHWTSRRDSTEQANDRLDSPINAEEIRRLSPFWDDLARRVTANRLKTAYVITPDMTTYVSSFRFGSRVVQRPIFELQISDVDAQLSVLEKHLEKEYPIRSPESGWNALKRRLATDLSPRQTCLPHQLVTAIRGVSLLPYVTPEVYVAKGGLLGMCSLALDVAADEIAAGEISSADFKQEWRSENVLLICSALSAAPGRRATMAEILNSARTLAPPETLQSMVDFPAQDARWQQTMDRLRDRRLVRLRNERPDGAPVYELRHLYVGAAAREALQRRAPLRAEVARRAAAHSAAETVAQWWTTLLPVTRQLRLWYARLTSSFRFLTYRRYVSKSLVRLALWILGPIVYVLLADTGMALPLGETVRSGLDALGITVFRQPADPDTSVANLRLVRVAVGDEIVNRCEQTKWCNSLDGNARFHEETWATSQALAAVLAFTSAKNAKRAWLDDSFHEVLDSKYKIQKDGRTVGWTLGELAQCPVVEPAMWLAIAIGLASRDAQRSAKLNEDLRGWRDEIAQAVNSFSLAATPNRAAFSEFQTDVEENLSLPPSIYATALALLRELELAQSDPNARKQVSELARWLVKSMHRRGPLDPADGWQSENYDVEQISPGVTMQVLYGLLRAREIAPEAVPQDIAKIALPWLKTFLNVEDPFSETATVFIGGYEAQNTVQHFGHVVRFMWYPWAVGVSLELQRAYSANASNSQRLTVARSLEHFAILAQRVFTPAKNLQARPTYQLSEFVFAMELEH